MDSDIKAGKLTLVITYAAGGRAADAGRAAIATAGAAVLVELTGAGHRAATRPTNSFDLDLRAR